MADCQRMGSSQWGRTTSAAMKCPITCLGILTLRNNEDGDALHRGVLDCPKEQAGLKVASAKREQQVVSALRLSFGNRSHKAWGNLMEDFFKVLTEESITGNY